MSLPLLPPLNLQPLLRVQKGKKKLQLEKEFPDKIPLLPDLESLNAQRKLKRPTSTNSMPSPTSYLTFNSISESESESESSKSKSGSSSSSEDVNER